jgi:hypothetical protein
MDVLVYDLLPEQKIDGQNPASIPGYFVCSTAPINMEDDERKVDKILPTIYDVVEHLYQNSKSDAQDLGLVIQIHGYNTGVKEGQKDYIQDEWAKVCEYLNKDRVLKDKKNSFVYLGYRWPSESVPSNFKNSLSSLPFALKIFFWLGLLLTILGFLSLIRFSSNWFALLILLGAFLSTIVITFLILRIIVYFRDSYRANNFAVPDLLEFIRQLDRILIRREIFDSSLTEIKNSLSQELVIEPEILELAIRKSWENLESQTNIFVYQNETQIDGLISKIKNNEKLAQVNDDIFRKIFQKLAQDYQKKNPTIDNDYEQAQTYWNSRRIKLTFIGHSMGGFITTQVVRILSNVFDPQSIGNVDNLDKNPSPEIGRVFYLGRLILLSPDIPVNTILSGRTNFLRSSLRRFEEAYLFSNEGDLALRLASTAANYFSFPAKSRIQGYRLGNVTVNLPEKKDVYGIVNLARLSSSNEIDNLLKYVGIKILNQKVEQNLLDSESQNYELKCLIPKQEDPESIADLFTYIDCTEYRDTTDYKHEKGKTINVLICEGQKSPLTFWEYVKLLKAYLGFSLSYSKGRDVHGGYFYGHFSKLMIYRVAFMGFQEFLDSLLADTPSKFHLDVPPDLQEKLNRKEELNSVERHKMALEYFSWICEQKLLQVALSSERYRVNVFDEPRQDIRYQILSKNV